MSKVKIIFGLGLSTAVIPFLGFPSSWKDFFLLAIGLVIAGIAFFIHYTEKKQSLVFGKHESVTNSYVENTKVINSSHS